MAKCMPSYFMADIADDYKVNKLGLVNLNFTFQEKTTSIETVETTLNQSHSLTLAWTGFTKNLR